MKSAWIVAVMVCVVLTSAAFAQGGIGTLNPRALGMGVAVTGMADDGSAWFQNPAGLGALNLSTKEDKTWANDAIGGFADMGGNDAWGATWSGWQPAKAMGFGAGFADFDSSYTMFGAGFGMALKDSPFSLGVNVYSIDPNVGSSKTFFDLGAMYQFAQPEKAPIRAGFVVRDIADEVQTTFDLGVAWPADPNWLFAVDIRDLTDEINTKFDLGAEYKFGAVGEWAGRAGLLDDGVDNNLTLGLGYSFANNWRVDAAWVDGNADDAWAIAAGFGF